jgi:hypothetical protein
VIARWFFPLFFFSGACALGYQVVWLRLAMAHHGVNTPIVAVVLSVFMGGISVGSLLAGALARRGAISLNARGSASPLRLYALAELAIALSGLVVPFALAAGSPFALLFDAGEAWSSLAHYLASGFWIATVLGPGAIAMGATHVRVGSALVTGWASLSLSCSSNRPTATCAENSVYRSMLASTLRHPNDDPGWLRPTA